MVLANSPVTTMLPITDVDRARSFYGTVLELPYQGTNSEGSLIFTLQGGATLGLMVRAPGAQAEHTAMSFEVEDIEAVIAELKSRGAEFQDYDLPGLKTANHVCVLGSERAAWLLDPDGNVLCLHETT
jgi:predicted enzyme related to lactoylglutathione lyase